MTTGEELIDNSIHIGLKIKQLRKQRQVNQQAVASIIRCPRSAVSMIEAGKRDLSAVEIKRLCIAFDISADWVIGDL